MAQALYLACLLRPVACLEIALFICGSCDARHGGPPRGGPSTTRRTAIAVVVAVSVMALIAAPGTAINPSGLSGTAAYPCRIAKPRGHPDAANDCGGTYTGSGR